MEPAVSVQDLAYTYRGQKEPALDGVSLDVALVVGLLLGSAAGGAPGGLRVGLGLIPFLIAIVVASFLLGGREQVEAAEEEVTADTGATR